MKSCKHILWDWNGTLLDDVWLCVEIIGNLLEKRDKPRITLQRYFEIFDFPVKGYYQRAGFDFETERFDKVCTEYCDEYAARVGECRLNENATAVLKQCKVNEVSQSILSTTEQSRLQKMTDLFGVSHFFERIVGQTDHYANGKIESGKRLLDELGLHGDEVLLVGDTTHDFQVAEAIGVDCVLVSVGHHRIAELERTGVRVLSTLSDLVHLQHASKTGT